MIVVENIKINDMKIFSVKLYVGVPKIWPRKNGLSSCECKHLFFLVTFFFRSAAGGRYTRSGAATYIDFCGGGQDGCLTCIMLPATSLIHEKKFTKRPDEKDVTE